MSLTLNAPTKIVPTNGVHSNGHAAGLRPLDPVAIKHTRPLLEQMQADFGPKIQLVSSVDVSARKLNVACESAPIQSVVVSMPTYLDWSTAINELEKLNDHNRPDRAEAVKQHANFLRAMLQFGIEVIVIEPSRKRLEGVYTRDIGFTIGGQCFAANMVKPARRKEEKTITGGIKPPEHVKIEGGNVIVNGDFVFLGVGDRTNEAAVQWLQQCLGSSKQVVPLHLHAGVLHADCVFLPISSSNGQMGRALIHEAAFVNPSEVAYLQKVFGYLHPVNPNDVPMLGLNAPCVGIDHGQQTRLVSAHAKGTIALLQEWGMKVIPVNLGEIIKAEGGPRCSTMPLVQAY